MFDQGGVPIPATVPTAENRRTGTSECPESLPETDDGPQARFSTEGCSTERPETLDLSVPRLAALDAAADLCRDTLEIESGASGLQRLNLFDCRTNGRV